MMENSENQVTPIPGIPFIPSSPLSVSSIPEKPRYHCWGCQYMKIKPESGIFPRGHSAFCLKKNQSISINIFHSIPRWCPTDGDLKYERIEE